MPSGTFAIGSACAAHRVVLLAVDGKSAWRPHPKTKRLRGFTRARRSCAPGALCLRTVSFIYAMACALIEEIKTVWPSGLRRWLKAPFRKGVGSNPTAVIDRAAFAQVHTRGATSVTPLPAALACLCKHTRPCFPALTCLRVSRCQGAHGVVASHPLRMWKALGSNPSVSICFPCIAGRP